MHGGMSTENSPNWKARIWDVSPAGAPWDIDGSGGDERFKLVCVGRTHRTDRIATRPALRDAYVAARRSGRTRIELRELRIGATHHPHRSPDTAMD
jgi:hypothetical protein